MHARPDTITVLFAASFSALLVACGQPPLEWPGVDSVPVPSNHRLHEPSWSPDGTRVAVVADTAPGREIGELVIVDPDDEAPVELDQGCAFYEPHWAPDGTKLLFSGCDDTSVVTYPALAHTMTIPGEQAEWAPDGTRFVIYEYYAPGIQRPGSIYVADRDGQPVTILFSNTDERFAFGGLAWSRSADRIAFSFGSVPGSSTAPLQRDVYVVAPDGTGLTALAATPADEFDPSWSPDGRWLVYIAAQEYAPPAVGTITFARADGSCVLPALSSERLTGVDWSPDGGRLAVTFRDKLYIVDIAATFGEGFANLDAHCPPPGSP